MATRTQGYFYKWKKIEIKEEIERNLKLPEGIGVDIDDRDLPTAPYQFVFLYTEGEPAETCKELFPDNRAVFTKTLKKKKGDELEPKELLIKKLHQTLVSLQHHEYTIFNDPIHETVKLHPLLTKIIQTRVFDRLKHIKQLAGVHYVYHGTTHTRFEHSIGTCYIAGEFVRMLQTQQPELGITDREVLCVEIAGLCHDLGHGCFSHLFEKDVLKSEEFQKELKHLEQWRHEAMSALIFRHCACKELDTEFKKYGLMDKDFEMIGDLIAHDKDFSGVIPQKRFLYEIVANKKTGIDVDKWDYFARDCHYLGIPSEFQWRRLMALSRVVTDENGAKRIAYRDKEVHNIYGMFRTRSSLHQKAYQHKTVIGVEHMIALAIVKARNIPLLCGSDGLSAPISVCEAVKKALKDKDFDGFLSLTDAIFYQIQSAQPSQLDEHECKALKEAKDLLASIPQRFIFHVVDASDFKNEENCPEDDLYTRTVSISYGSEDDKSRDPVNSVLFYRKKEPWKAVTGSELKKSELVIPQKFEEKEVRRYKRQRKSMDDDFMYRDHKKAKQK